MGSAERTVAAAATGGLSAIAYSMYDQRKAMKEQQKQLEALSNKPPAAPGTPPATPVDANPALTNEQRSKKLASLRYGIASTIKSNPTLTPNLGLNTALGQ